MTQKGSRPPLDLLRIQDGSAPLWHDVRVLETTQSTNADAAAFAREGAPEGTVVVAEHQTGGRGRLDRAWNVPSHAAITASLILRPEQVPPARWPWLSIMAGLAVAEALTHHGVKAVLKWPNDVLVRDRKIAGILLERVDTDDGPAAVIGIGINVHQSREEIPVPTGTSVALEVPGVPSRDAILVDVLDTFAGHYNDWIASDGDPYDLRKQYILRCATLGQKVRVSLPDGSHKEGKATGVDEHARLVVDGEAFSVGDVVHVRKRP